MEYGLRIILFKRATGKLSLIGYADAGYLSNPHNARSQIGYIFTYNNTTILW